MNIGACSFPLSALLVDGLDLKPIIVIFLIHFHICNNGFELFFEAILPLLIFGPCVNAQYWAFMRGFFDTVGNTDNNCRGTIRVQLIIIQDDDG